MRSKLLKLCGALAGAVVVVCAAVANTASANDLEMFIENQSPQELTYQAKENVTEYPETIQAGATSSEIKANKGPIDVPIEGHIAYATSTPSCSVTLNFQFVYNEVTGHCDNKKFTPETGGTCTLQQAGDCYGAGSCKCNFNFNTQGQ